MKTQLRKTRFFDLDGTLIDSSHRKAALPNGDLDLAHWRENSTPDKIALDSLLPLYSYFRGFEKLGDIVICTARVMSVADWEYLKRFNINFSKAYSRPSDNGIPDSELKRENILHYCRMTGCERKQIVMIDDNPSVLKMARELGCETIDAAYWNERLKNYEKRSSLSELI